MRECNRSDKDRMALAFEYADKSYDSAIAKDAKSHILYIAKWAHLYHSSLSTSMIREAKHLKGEGIYNIIQGKIQGNHKLSYDYCLYIFDRFHKKGKEPRYYYKHPQYIFGAYYKSIKKNISDYIPIVSPNALISLCSDSVKFKKYVDMMMNKKPIKKKNIKYECISIKDMLKEEKDKK